MLMSAPRRRYLTVLFADLSNSTQLGSAIEAEHYAETLAALRVAYRNVIPRHGGIVVRMQGDGILAIFGYPDAREDDGRRATEAALELHAAVRRLRIESLASWPIDLGLHSGIHAGLVLLGDGDLELGRFELLGNVPNIAARLSSVAGFDEILVSEESLGPQSHFFLTGETRALSLKGRLQPLMTCRVIDRAPIPTTYQARTLRGLAPFVGRHAEMLSLESRLLAAVGGTPRFVAITGSPGLGKSRLVEQFLKLAGTVDCSIHRGYCESYLSAEPLQPFLQMLRTLFGLAHGTAESEAEAKVDAVLAGLDPALADHRADLLRALSVTVANTERRRINPERIVGALGLLFDALGAKGPLLIFIDDWQWADDASRQVFDAILRLQRPIFALVASRHAAANDSSLSGATEIALAPLNVEETGRTIERLLPGTDPFLAAEIHRYGGGNPLFIEELCHSAAAEGSGPHLGRPHAGAAWMDMLIESRVARLAAPLAGLVRVAAVLGNVFPAWLLESISGHGEHDAQVLALAEQDFIFPAAQPGMLRFKHGITRDVIYEGVGLHERRAMHLRAAEALTAQDGGGDHEELYEALAYHWSAAGRTAEAARFAELAGDKAMAASALDRARAQYRAALLSLDALGTDRPEVRSRWISVVQRLGMVCVFDPLGLEDGPVLFERGVALARQGGNETEMARTEYWLGYIYYAKGYPREAVRHSEESLGVAMRIGDMRLAGQVRATLGQSLAAACDYEHALGHLNAAIDMKRRHVSVSGNVAVGSSYSLACKGLVLGDRGDFDDARQCCAEALELISGSGHQVESSVLACLSTICQWQGCWAEALQAARQARDIADRCKSSHLFAMHQGLAGYAEWMLDGRAESLALVKDATTWIEARKGRFYLSLNHGWLSDGLVTLGRSAEARLHAARALQRARALDRLGEAMTWRALARDAAQHGDGPRAAHCIEQALCSADRRGSRHERAATLLCQAELAAQEGRRDDARELLDSASAAFDGMRMAWHLEQAERVRAGL